MTCLSLKRDKAQGFTLVEVMVAMIFLTILVPVGLKAVQISSRAGQVAERKVRAAMIADRLLTEMTVINGMQQAGQKGNVTEGGRNYSWSMDSVPWFENSLRLVTLQVSYSVQGQNYDVKLHTLYDSSGVTTNGVTLAQ
jgi:type II secretion system protein I